MKNVILFLILFIVPISTLSTLSTLFSQDVSLTGKQKYYGNNSRVYALGGIRSIIKNDSAFILDNPLAASRLLRNNIFLFGNNLFSSNYSSLGGAVSIPTDIGVLSLGVISTSENSLLSYQLDLYNQTNNGFEDYQNAEKINLIETKAMFSKEVFKNFDFGASFNFDYGTLQSSDDSVDSSSFLGISIDLAFQILNPPTKKKSIQEEEIFGFYNFQYGLFIQNLGILPAIADHFYKSSFLKGGAAFDIVYLPITFDSSPKNSSKKIRGVFFSKILTEFTMGFPLDVHITLANQNTVQFSNLKWGVFQLNDISLMLGSSLEFFNENTGFFPLFFGVSSKVKIFENVIDIAYSFSDSYIENKANHNVSLNVIFGSFDSSNPEVNPIFEDNQNDIKEGIIIED